MVCIILCLWRAWLAWLGMLVRDAGKQALDVRLPIRNNRRDRGIEGLCHTCRQPLQKRLNLLASESVMVDKEFLQFILERGLIWLLQFLRFSLGFLRSCLVAIPFSKAAHHRLGLQKTAGALVILVDVAGNQPVSPEVLALLQRIVSVFNGNALFEPLLFVHHFCLDV